MAETYGLSCCSSALVPKSKLLHNSEAHHGFILKLSHPIGKNIALRAEKLVEMPLNSQHPTSPLFGEAIGVFRAATGVAAAPQRGANPPFVTEGEGGRPCFCLQPKLELESKGKDQINLAFLFFSSLGLPLS